MTIIYTDGACLGNPGPGGWAWAMAPDGVPFAAGAAPESTNQRMELQAVLEALKANDGQVEIVSDSQYVVKCFNDRWWAGWEKRGFRNAKGAPIANRDLWDPLLALYHERATELTFRWTKGHAGEPMNERVDQLANNAATTQMDVTG